MPRTLLIEGEAGIGKTTIWRESFRIAEGDSRLLTARPSESEAKLSFSVLTDLLEPTLHEIRDELPVPQRRALESALLLKAPIAGTRVDAGGLARNARRNARVWAEKARRALARIGGRPPSPSGLSPSEEQVALLVAEGHSNREVAASLFMSVHTVEANLKRIYRKLGVRSRVELARKLGERLDV